MYFNNTGNSFTAVDLSKLPFPGVIEEISFEAIYQSMREQMQALQPVLFSDNGKPILKNARLTKDNNGEVWFKIPFAGEDKLLFLELESDPSARQLQVVAYREMLIRQRINNACKAVMLAYAQGADLEQIGAQFGVKRLLIKEADTDNNIPAQYEQDDDLRYRIQLSPEGFSTAGPEGAYIFHTLSASSQVKDAAIQSPTFKNIALSSANRRRGNVPRDALILEVNNDAGLTKPLPGDVAVTVLSREGNGQAGTALLDLVFNKLNKEKIRPVNDRVRPRSAEIIEYKLKAKVYTYSGPDSELIIKESKAACLAYCQQHHKLGHDITLSGVLGALHCEGIQRVELQNFNPIPCDPHQAAFCTGIELVHGGQDD